KSIEAPTTTPDHPRPANRLIACRGERIIATVRYQRQDDRLHLMGLGVHPDFRRQGVARRLIRELTAIARRTGVRALSLYTVTQTGNPAIFQRLGFRIVSEAPDEW